MKSIDRVFISEDFITLTLIFGVIILFIIKIFYPKQLSGYTKAFFTQGFIEKNAEQQFSFLNYFYILLQVFSIITISLILYIFITPKYYESTYSTILVITSFTTLYFIIKNITVLIIFKLFLLKEYLNYLMYTKNGYLYTCCLFLFPCLIFYQYAFKEKLFLSIVISLLLIFRLFLIVNNNKKTLRQHFFYFILYFCTLEIAPVLLLYKTIIK